jgi:hypothetical protein
MTIHKLDNFVYKSMLHFPTEICMYDVEMFHDFVDEVERWTIRWALVYDNPERLLDTLHSTNRDLYTAIYSLISILLTIPVSSVTSARSVSAMRRVKSYLRSTMGNKRLSNL